MVIWLIGLSGAGKSSVGRALHELWRARDPATVLMDGDEVRAIFGQDRSPADYTVRGRRVNAVRLYEMCAWLDRQHINAVCCVLSIFPDIQALCRTRYSSYFEVFVDVPLNVLAARDDKGLYGPALAGKTRDVVGVDIAFPRPPLADLVLDNSGFDTPPRDLALAVARRAGLAGFRPVEFDLTRGLGAVPQDGDMFPRAGARAVQEGQTAPQHGDEATTDYPYASGDRLRDPNTYFYTPGPGRAMLDAWRSSRDQALADLPPPVPAPAPAEARLPAWGEPAQTAPLLEALFAGLLSTGAEGDLGLWLDALARRFEVGKRLHPAYDGRFRPLDKRDFGHTGLYVRAAEALLLAAEAFDDSVYLNASLKIVDTLCSVRRTLGQDQGARLAGLIARERCLVEALRREGT